jgi:AcrR family transcriptional regulator
MAKRTPARERLLQAAADVMFERGIRATPVDELLHKAGVSAATMYAHFGSKEALVGETLRLRLGAWRSVWDQHVIEADDDVGRLLAVFDALASYRDSYVPRARWCAFLATASELPGASDEISEVLAADTALLTERLLHFSRPIAGERAQDLADEVLMAYGGTLAAFLRGYPEKPIDVGRRLARSAAQALQLQSHPTADPG